MDNNSAQQLHRNDQNICNGRDNAILGALLVLDQLADISRCQEISRALQARKEAKKDKKQKKKRKRSSSPESSES